VDVEQYFFADFRKVIDRTDMQRFAKERGRNSIAPNLNRRGTLREIFLYSAQVTQHMPAVSRGFPRTIWDNPIDFTKKALSERGADEIRDGNRLVGGNPPHVVVRVHVNQDALRATGITPNRKRFVVILNTENSAQRSILRFAFRGSKKQLVHFRPST